MLTDHQLRFQRIFICCCLLACAVVLYYVHASGENGQLRTSLFRLHRPVSTHRLYPSNWSLIDRKSFEFLLNTDVCGQEPVRLLISVTSHPGHVALRQAFRSALPASVLWSYKIRRIFLLAQIDPVQLGYDHVNQSAIEEEHVLHRDIVQGDFVESYRHLSYKHVLGLKYAVHFCSQARFILKMDDDIAVDVFQLLDLFETSGAQPSQRVIFGSVMTDGELDPLRDTSSKWYVTYDEYAMAKYPPFEIGRAHV